MQANITHRQFRAVTSEDCIMPDDDVVSTILFVDTTCEPQIPPIIDLIVFKRKNSIEYGCYLNILRNDVSLFANATAETYSEAILKTFDRLGLSFERPEIGSPLGCTGFNSYTPIRVIFDAIAAAVGVPNSVKTELIYANEWVPSDKVVPIYHIVISLPKEESQ